MPRYILSPAAKSSLRQIKVWSLERFGSQTTQDYLGRLRQKMRGLVKEPLTGRHRPEVKAGYYSAFVGSHTIYYRLADADIEIVDVLHQSMEPQRNL